MRLQRTCWLAILSLVPVAPLAAQAEGSPASLSAEPLFFALSVADVDESVRWYTEGFDLEVVREVDLEERGIRIRLLRGPSGFLELVEQASARPLEEIAPDLGRRHQLHGVFKVGFQVPDLDVAMGRLAALGVSTRGQVATEADGSFRSVQIVDPDGNILQLFEALETPAPEPP